MKEFGAKRPASLTVSGSADAEWPNGRRREPPVPFSLMNKMAGLAGMLLVLGLGACSSGSGDTAALIATEPAKDIAEELPRETTTTEEPTTTTVAPTATVAPTTTARPTTTTARPTTTTARPTTTTAAASAENCTPGYDPCIPPGSDVDCAGGSGNGPRYTGRVEVSGSDPYDLDRDGDGVGCE